MKENDHDEKVSISKSSANHIEPSSVSIEAPAYGVGIVQRKENDTGLPEQVKSGVESLSGTSLDDVKVHYNSQKPEKLGALAYTQGNQIDVGPNQENHLAHEAWHVVQQKQGRVTPNTQIGGVAVNDDKSLESEADQMGEQALKQSPIQRKADHISSVKASNVTQFVMPEHEETSSYGDPQTGPVAHQGEGDDHAISPNDVNQGSVGDCSVLASLIAISSSNPELLANAINERDDGTYDITLYKRERHGFLWLSSSLRPVTINVDSSLPQNNLGGGLTYARGGDEDAEGNRELWVSLIEKAYAQHAGGYDGINGVWGDDALETLTGREATRTGFKGGFLGIGNLDESEISTQITEALANNQFVVASRTPTDYDDLNDADTAFAQTNGIFGNHQYGVIAADEAGITVRNPHGEGTAGGVAQVTLSWAQFRRMFNDFSMTSS